MLEKILSGFCKIKEEHILLLRVRYFECVLWLGGQATEGRGFRLKEIFLAWGAS